MHIQLFFLIISTTLTTIHAQDHAQHTDHGITAAVQARAHSLHEATHKTHAHGMYGNYPMTREASGTSWVPDSSPAEMFHKMYQNWTLMVGGFSYVVTDNQFGPRGDKKIFDENMFMFMGQRDYHNSTFAFRSMFSLEGATIGKCGYPLLFQTGETCDGTTPLVDRQHPHDLFMELALVATQRFNDTTSAFLYFGLPGEPALGPPVFVMRFASEYIPQAPLGHHWMDSTHITFGVLTAGFVHKGFKLEFSAFNGSEPDEHRFDIEKPKFNSYACRVSYNPTEHLALQASYAFIKGPEQLHPETNIRRSTASIIYNKPFHDDCSNVQTCAILGINNKSDGKTLPAFLWDTTVLLHNRHMLFGRFEIVQNDELFIEPNPLAHKTFSIKLITCGYVFEFLHTTHTKWGIGSLVDFPLAPTSLDKEYSSNFGYMFFLQVKLI